MRAPPARPPGARRVLTVHRRRPRDDSLPALMVMKTRERRRRETPIVLADDRVRAGGLTAGPILLLIFGLLMLVGGVVSTALYSTGGA